MKLMRNTNLKLLFDLNLQLRYGIQWDPTNTASLLGYVNKMKYHDVFNFELGNGKTIFKVYINVILTQHTDSRRRFLLIPEPDLFHEHGVASLNGSRIGIDLVILHNVISKYNFTKFTFVGPDSANVFSKAAVDLFSECVHLLNVSFTILSLNLCVILIQSCL